MDITDKLADASRAVISRWDSPLWKDLPSTATYINKLRQALTEYEQYKQQPSDTDKQKALKALSTIISITKLEDIENKQLGLECVETIRKALQQPKPEVVSVEGFFGKLNKNGIYPTEPEWEAFVNKFNVLFTNGLIVKGGE